MKRTVVFALALMLATTAAFASGEEDEQKAKKSAEEQQAMRPEMKEDGETNQKLIAKGFEPYYHPGSYPVILVTENRCAYGKDQIFAGVNEWLDFIHGAKNNCTDPELLKKTHETISQRLENRFYKLQGARDTELWKKYVNDLENGRYEYVDYRPPNEQKIFAPPYFSLPMVSGAETGALTAYPVMPIGFTIHTIVTAAEKPTLGSLATRTRTTGEAEKLSLFTGFTWNDGTPGYTCGNMSGEVGFFAGSRLTEAPENPGLVMPPLPPLETAPPQGPMVVEEERNWFTRGCIGPVPRWACIVGAGVAAAYLTEFTITKGGSVNSTPQPPSQKTPTPLPPRPGG